jgi:regulator of chromosome condensation
MAPKKAAGSAPSKSKFKSKSTTSTSEPTANGITKVKAEPKATKKTTTTTKKAATKAPAKAPAKRAAKSTATKAPAKTMTKSTAKETSTKVTANTSRKRKAAEEDQDEPQVNGVKRQRTATKSATPAPAAPKRKVAAAKEPAVKKPKKKTIVNTAPADRLDVYVFGEGSSGELGLGSAKGQTEVKRPRLNPNLAADTVGVVATTVGGMHAAALTHDNKILTWGVNDQAALGRDTAWDGGLRDIDDDKSDSDSDSGSDTGVNPIESTPGPVDMSALPDDIVWTQVEATDSATFALTDDGLVYGWGTFRVSHPTPSYLYSFANHSQSNEGIFGFDPDTLIQKTPKLIQGLKNVTQLASGANHVLALTKKGEVYAWGSGQQNQLGRRILERTKMNSLIPTQFGLPKQIVRVGAGSYHSFAIHKNGNVYAWGLNSFGETGIAKEIGEGGESDVHHATIITSLDKFGKVICINGGAHHTVAATDKGELLVWGRLDGYQLGLPIASLPEDDVVRDSANNPRILKVPTQIPGVDAVQCSAGSDHCVAVDKNGKAWSWGFSTTYQTGLGTDDDVEVATMIDNTATRGKKLVWAGCGGQFSVLAGIAGATMPVVNGV